MEGINSTLGMNSYEKIAAVTFSWYDYILFTVVLILSPIVGIYFGCFGSKQSTKHEYLLGNKQMKPLPVGISLTAGGVDSQVIMLIVFAVCVFYTSIGGLKTVIWTDTFQFMIAAVSLVVVLVLGINSAGGIKTIWNKSLQGNRLNIFDFDPDPTKRESFWIMLVGATLALMSYSTIDQGFIQKFLAMATFREAVLSVVCLSIGVITVTIISVFTGLIIYVKYSDCDPLTTKVIQSYDQLVPYYVVDVSRDIPGLSGIYIAGLISAALSSLSALLNGLTAVIYEDFVSKFLKKNLSQKNISRILKLITLAIGIISCSTIFFIRYLGDIFSLVVAWTGLTCGPILGTFTLGILFPRANAKGAFYGCIVTLILTTSIVLPAKYYEMIGVTIFPPKPVSASKCLLNETKTESVIDSTFQPHSIFRISFYYYNFIGTVSCIVLGLIISYLTNKNDPPIDKLLISPIMHFLLPKENVKNVRYDSIEKSLQTLTTNTK